MDKKTEEENKKSMACIIVVSPLLVPVLLGVYTYRVTGDLINVGLISFSALFAFCFILVLALAVIKKVEKYPKSDKPGKEES